MGYGVHRFVCAIDPNLLCGICSAVLEDAVLTPCGHTFCSNCLDTWLAKPATNTCPECRSHMNKCDSKPVLSLRNLINGFDVVCDNSDRGCKVLVKLERLRPHLESCSYHPVECAGCAVTVNRCDLADHQIRCEGIAAVVEEPDESRGVRRLRYLKEGASITANEVSDLLFRISSLEFQIKNLKRDLQISESKNRMIERECRKVKDELQTTKNELIDMQYAEFDPSYDYGYTPQSIAKLSLLISRFLLQKPGYIHEDKIFEAVKRCYDQYSRCGTEYEHDVHMLVATSFASNWFSDGQRIHFHCWLQSICRQRQYNISGKTLIDSCENRRTYSSREHK